MRFLLPLNPAPPLDEALALAAERRASVTALWVIDTRWPDLIGDEWLVRESVRQRFFRYLAAQEREEGEDALREFQRRAEEAGVRASIRSEAGDPAKVVQLLSPTCDAVLLPTGGGREVRRLEKASAVPVLRLEPRRSETPA